MYGDVEWSYFLSEFIVMREDFLSIASAISLISTTHQLANG
jgi:pilus assembly protein TadC